MLFVKKLMVGRFQSDTAISLVDPLTWFYALANIAGLAFLLFIIYAIVANKKEWLSKIVKKETLDKWK